MPRFFANGKDLKDCITKQNEFGQYWLVGGALWGTILANFDSGKGKPSNAVKKSGGSHASYLNEHALDISLNAGTNITCSESIKINGFKYISGYKIPYGIELVYGNHHIIVYHVKTKWKVGDRVPAGQVICTVMSAAENKSSGRFDKENPNGFPPHLHIGTNNTGTFDKKTIRQFILEAVSTPPIVTPPVVTPPVTPPPSDPPIDPDPIETIKHSELVALRHRISELEGQLDASNSVLSSKITAMNKMETERDGAINEKNDAVALKNAAEKERDQMKQYITDFEDEHVGAAIRVILSWITRKIGSILPKIIAKYKELTAKK